MKKTISENSEVSEQNEVFIDISVKTLEDLYNKSDQNASCTEKNLSQEFVDHIIDSINETGENEFIIRINTSNMPDEKAMSCVQNIIETKFQNLKDLENQSIEKMFSQSFKLFGLGLILLFIAIVFNRHFSSLEGFMSQFFYEGLTLAGWISLMASIVTIFIKWPLHKENIKLYERVIKAQVIFRNQFSGGTDN